ncbi:nucleotide exchange factor GrpE [Parvicella tangerina]|uniref:Protein GrpE n=1 Tax=Parvicella tangerina TaxID=2829795 RepID=A0A916JKE7_9FLAO|nr:nucleotide exchange factor GrpE [Parvicella tangerina]CAG5078361.1 Protein GrpE [Parvicella tangerina]
MSKENVEKKAEEQEEVTSAQNDSDSKEEETVETEPTEELSELEKKEMEYKELHDKYIRLFSEFDNFRKRTAKEKLDLMASAGGDIMKEMLPILDDFERAMANNQNAEDIESIKEGFNLIHNKLIHNLTNKGLKPMESMHEEFDVNKHEALTQIPAPSEDLKGKVVDVVEKGYLLNDKVLRFAKVVVGQ